MKIVQTPAQRRLLQHNLTRFQSQRRLGVRFWCVSERPVANNPQSNSNGVIMNMCRLHIDATLTMFCQHSELKWMSSRSLRQTQCVFPCHCSSCPVISLLVFTWLTNTCVQADFRKGFVQQYIATVKRRVQHRISLQKRLVQEISKFESEMSKVVN